MENDNAAERKNEEASSPPSNQLFNVVYDPHFDRFFLEDEDVYQSRNRVSIPWKKWILPPKSPTKSPPKRVRQDNVTSTVKDPANDSVPTDKDTSPQQVASVEVKNHLLTGNISAEEDNLLVEIPTLDLSNVKPLAEVLSPTVESISVSSKAVRKPKKTRVADYRIHFERSNQDVAKIMVASVANAKPNHEHTVKWNGQELHVQFPGLRPELESSLACTKSESQQREHLHGSTQDQWLASSYKLKNLMRIRAHADGLRRVNSANRFVAVSSSESSDSEAEVRTPSKQESEDENELMPVFFRDDRVLFRAKHRWFKGSVRRRIPKSDFYNIRADNGSLFDAVLASNMELLDEPEELPYYQYTKGDKILWVPDAQNNNSDDEELTYKAKIVHVHSVNRFDLLLRTGRVVKKVPYEQLRPRDEADFVSTATSRRR